MSGQENYLYEFGPFSLDPSKRRLLREGEPVPLAPKAFDTLLALVRHGGRTVEKDDLMRLVWPDAAVEENNLNQNITALRKCLGDSRQESRYIVTVPGLGYRFVAEVRGAAAGGAETEAPPASPAVASIAVLPLENLCGDPAQEYFADGMTDALIGELARIEGLRVTSRTSSMRYKGTRKSLPEVARELKVDAVVEGTVQRSGVRVRVAVQLIHAATDRSLWANSYERNLRDVLALQREVAEDIVSGIRVKLSPREPGRRRSARPVNPAAYDHYLRGKYYMHRQSRDDTETAVAALERAVSADPDFADAHAELAQAYVWKLFLFAPDEGHLAEKAYVATEKALALDQDSAAAYLARGRLLWTPANRFPHEKAIREYRRALTLNPNLDEARHQLALVYNHVGALDEALRELERAVEANPNNTPARYRIGETLLFQCKYEEALAALRGVPKEVNPALVGHQTAWALFNLGRDDEASHALEQFLKDYPEDTGGLFSGVRAVLAASAGMEREAERVIGEAVERGEGFGHFHHTAYHIACAYAHMNRPGPAIDWLERAADDGFPCYPLFEGDANLNSLRRDERFVNFMRRVRGQWEFYMTFVRRPADGPTTRVGSRSI